MSSGLSDMGGSGMELNEVNELNDAMTGVNIDEKENAEGSSYWVLLETPPESTHTNGLKLLTILCCDHPLTYFIMNVA